MQLERQPTRFYGKGVRECMTALFIGRYQGFHAAHRALVEVALAEGQDVIIALRDTPRSERDPYTIQERTTLIRQVYPDERRVRIVTLPDFDDLCYGRDVGYRIRRINLDAVSEAISGTAERRRHRPAQIVWLTGNTGSGKSTLAYALQPLTDGVILDGDVMRASISTDLTLSPEDRNEHNWRVARLAAVLRDQGYNVIVAVIAPFLATRHAIGAEIQPVWVYCKRGEVLDASRPYEVGGYDLMIDNAAMTPEAAAATVYRHIWCAGACGHV